MRLLLIRGHRTLVAHPATLQGIRHRHRGADLLVIHAQRLVAIHALRQVVDDQAEEAASQAEDMANPNPLANTRVELFSAGFTDVTVRS